MTFNPPRLAEIMDVDTQESTEDAQSVTSHPTEIARSQTQGSLTLPPDFMARQKERARSPGTSLSIFSRHQIQRIDRILGRFDPALQETRDAQHLAYSALNPEAFRMVEDLQRVKEQLNQGATIVGEELTRIDKQQVKFLDQETQRIQETFAARVAERLEAADSRQLRHEEVTSQLHDVVQGEGQQAMRRDLLLEHELQQVRRQHEEEVTQLNNQLHRYEERQVARDAELAQLKEGLRLLQNLDKGKRREESPTPEAGGAGGGNKPPPPKMKGAAAGAPGDGDDDGENSDDGDSHRNRKRREKPRRRKPPPDDDDDDDDHDGDTSDPEFNKFVRVMAKALGKTTRVPVEPPPVFKNEGHQDIRIWLVSCTDYFDANPW